LSEEHLAIAREYHQNGYVVVSDLVPESLLDEVRKELEEKAFDPDFLINTHRDTSRVQDFWLVSEPTAKLAALPAVLEILDML
jgi:hypothetical protein